MPTTSFQVLTSAGFADWLEHENVSLAFTTYKIGKVFFLGRKGGGISVFERTFNRCMGIWSDTETIWLASAFQLWRMQNVLPDGADEDGYDRLFVPQQAITTGDIDVHDLAASDNGELFFVNTLFCCIATTDEQFSFRPIWRPSFVTKLAPEDRCHLNGLAMRDGRPRYVTVCAQTDENHQWRNYKRDGGCVIDVESNEIVVNGLSMPHSPRFYDGKLWLLDSGNGYLGYVDLGSSKFIPVVFCPGFARGLTRIGKYAIVGLSKPRDATFKGLELDAELSRHGVQPICGLLVIDLETAQVVHRVEIEGSVDEMYDVVVLPGVKRPKALGLKTDEIRRNVWFLDGNRSVRFTAQDIE